MLCMPSNKGATTAELEQRFPGATVRAARPARAPTVCEVWPEHAWLLDVIGLVSWTYTQGARVDVTSAELRSAARMTSNKLDADRVLDFRALVAYMCRFWAERT
ncbi:MAG: hypothetical protein ACRDAM_05655 [Casimicrobium sp.]